MNDRTETAIQNAIRLVLSKCGLRVFRNNVGTATFPDGSRVVYGLGDDTPDLIGWMPVVVTQEMVGRKLAVFFGVEVKKVGALKKANKKHINGQINFLEQVVKGGGIGVMCDDEAKVSSLVEQSFHGRAVAIDLE